jgi:hypothetical protein
MSVNDQHAGFHGKSASGKLTRGWCHPQPANAFLASTLDENFHEGLEGVAGLNS